MTRVPHIESATQCYVLCPVGSGIVRALFKEDEASPIEDFRPDCVLGTLAFKAVSFKPNDSRLVVNTSYLLLSILHLRVDLGFKEAVSFMSNGFTAKDDLSTVQGGRKFVRDQEDPLECCPRRTRE